MTMKMTRDEKDLLKGLKKELPKGSTLAFDRLAGVTVLVVPEGPHTASLCTALAAQDEPKHYRRRGEMLVVNRYFDGFKVPVPRDTDAMEFLSLMTGAVSGMEGVYFETF